MEAKDTTTAPAGQTAEAAERRVRRGAELLDRLVPGWAGRVPQRVNSGWYGRDVVSQVDPAGVGSGSEARVYWAGLEWLYWRAGLAESWGEFAAGHGFDTAAEEEKEAGDDFTALSGAWEAAVRQRRAEGSGPTPG